MGVLLALPEPAAAQLFSVGDFDFSLTETLYTDWHYGQDFSAHLTDENTGETTARNGSYNYSDVKNRLNVTADSSWLQAGLRLDTATFIGPPKGSADEDLAYEQFARRFDDDYRVEKVFAKFRNRELTLEVGDFYGCLGKGIALCIRKIDELSLDSTIRGGKGAYRNDLVQVTALAGLSNIVNVGDKVEERLEDPNDIIMGFEGRLTPFPWLAVSVHSSLIRDKGDMDRVVATGNSTWREQIAVMGVTASAPDLLGHGSLFIEFDKMANEGVVQTLPGAEPQDVTVEDDGRALYAAATADWSPFHLLAELKWYEGFEGWGVPGKNVQPAVGTGEFVYYSALPPLEDEAMFVRSLDPYDVVGGRIRLDAEIPPTSSVLFSSYAHFDSTEDYAEKEADQNVRHLIVGIEQRIDSLAVVANLSGGKRWEKLGLDDRAMIHVDGDVHFPLVGPHSLEIAGRHESYDETSPSGDFSIYRAAASYTLAPLFSFSLIREFSDQPGPAAGAGDSFWDSLGLDLGRHAYMSAEVVARFTTDSYLKLIGGTTRGGLRCAGGVCRTFPPFEGVQGELTLRF